MPRRCCVPGCNSNYDKTVIVEGITTTFSFPKNEELQKKWLRAIHRKVWPPSHSWVVCIKHFRDSEVIKTFKKVTSEGVIDAPLNRLKLVNGAVPSIFQNVSYLRKSKRPPRKSARKRAKRLMNIPIQPVDDVMNKVEDVEGESVQHDVPILCNNCQNIIFGFRYKCITCENYNLCKKCEMMKIHSEHYMLRTPKPMEYKEEADIAQKLKQILPNSEILLIKEEDPVRDTITVCTDVATRQDDNVSGDIHLSERFKNIIQNEVSHVLDKCKETREPPLILQRKIKRKMEGGKISDEMRRCYANTKVNTASEMVFVASSGFDTHESSIEVKQEMCDEIELVSELDVSETINPYWTENHL